MVGFEREMQEETSMPGRFVHMFSGHQSLLQERLERLSQTYLYIPIGIRPEPIPAFELLDPDKGLPEWQKRRNASARAKTALVAKMRKRNAR